MKRLLVIPLLLGFMIPMAPSFSEAGVITRACLSSDRRAATPQLCRCIQRAADAELTRSDQRMAAMFFRDPHQAQEVRQSDRVSHEAFWDRYRKFGTRARSMCS